MANLLDSLVDRETGADGEQQHGDRERPEVALTAVSELMGIGGLFCRPFPAEQQQGLVSRVGDRVDALGEHRRGPGDEESDEFRDGDPEIRN